MKGLGSSASEPADSTSKRVKRGLVARLVRRLLREGWQRGVVEGSPAWTAAGGMALIGYLAGRAWHKDAEVVFSEKLLPGQVIRIAHEAAPLP